MLSLCTTDASQEIGYVQRLHLVLGPTAVAAGLMLQDSMHCCHCRPALNMKVSTMSHKSAALLRQQLGGDHSQCHLLSVPWSVPHSVGVLKQPTAVLQTEILQHVCSRELKPVCTVVNC